jgi:ATP-binding cassette subfamily B (MDR/TAP) protein 1
MLGFWSDKVSRQTSEVDGRASSFIEQILSSVRVVQSFDMSTKLIARLEHGFMGPLRKLSKKRSWVRAVEQGSTFGAGFLVYSMCFWFGGIEVARGQTVGDVLVVSTSVH